MLLKLKKLQSHSEAEEGVSVRQFKDRKEADLQTPIHNKTTVLTQTTPEHISAYRAVHIKFAEAYGNHYGDVDSGGAKKTPTEKMLDRLTHNERREKIAGPAISYTEIQREVQTTKKPEYSIHIITSRIKDHHHKTLNPNIIQHSTLNLTPLPLIPIPLPPSPPPLNRRNPPNPPFPTPHTPTPKIPLTSPFPGHHHYLPPQLHPRHPQKPFILFCFQHNTSNSARGRECNVRCLWSCSYQNEI
jgi:hypothetical protein